MDKKAIASWRTGTSRRMEQSGAYVLNERLVCMATAAC